MSNGREGKRANKKENTANKSSCKIKQHSARTGTPAPKSTRFQRINAQTIKPGSSGVVLASRKMYGKST